MHLRHPRFTNSACGPFTEKKKRVQKFKETGDSRYIFRNELDKACFQHDMVYVDFKDLLRRRASDKLLLDKAFNIAKNPKYDECQHGIASIVYRFFDKKSAGSGFTKIANESGIKNKNMSNLELAAELHKPII